MADRADPIGVWTFIAEDDGRPTPFFVRQWNAQLNVNAYVFNDIVAGAGLEGGGALVDGDVTLSLETLDPSPAGTFGSASLVPVVTVDTKGRVTGVTEASVSTSTAVEDDDVSVGSFSIFNFKGTPWTITDAGGGQVDIEVTAGSSLTIEDEGTPLTTAATHIDFAGAGVTATEPVTDQILVTIPGLSTQDEGSALGATDTMDFVGAGVTATYAAGKTTVTIPGGGSGVAVEDEGTSIGTATTLDFVGAGVTATFSAGQATITIPGGGGGGGAAYFNGMSGNDATRSANATATKGTYFTPDSDLSVTHVNVMIDPDASTNTYQGIILEMTDTTSSGTVVAVTATSTAVALGDTITRIRRFQLTGGPITLTAGTPYIIGSSRTDGTGTSVNRTFIGNSASDASALNAPGVTAGIYAYFNQITPTVSSSPSVHVNGHAWAWIEGTFTP